MATELNGRSDVERACTGGGLYLTKTFVLKHVLLQLTVLCEMLNITTEMVSTPLSYCTVSDTTLALLHSKGKGIFFIHTYS